MGSALGTAPARGPWGFRHHGTLRCQTPTSAHARCREGNGQERGRTLRARSWSRQRLENLTAKALRAKPSARRPPAARGGSVITEPRGARRPPASTHAVGLGTGKSGGGPYALATPQHSHSRAPSNPHGVHHASVRGPWTRHRLENPTAKALWAQPSARRPPAARGGSVITEPRGARCPPASTHPVGPGTGKSRGEPSTLATPPRSRSRAPSKPHGVRPASVRGPWSRHRLENPTEKASRAQPSARRPPAARGVPSSRNLESPDAHQRARTL